MSPDPQQKKKVKPSRLGEEQNIAQGFLQPSRFWIERRHDQRLHRGPCGVREFPVNQPSTPSDCSHLEVYSFNMKNMWIAGLVSNGWVRLGILPSRMDSDQCIQRVSTWEKNTWNTWNAGDSFSKYLKSFQQHFVPKPEWKSWRKNPKRLYYRYDSKKSWWALPKQTSSRQSFVLLEANRGRTVGRLAGVASCGSSPSGSSCGLAMWTHPESVGSSPEAPFRVS